MKWPSRRSVLRGLLRGGAVSIALPPLQCMFNSGGTAYACGGAIPKRFGLFFWGNGNIPDLWTPTGTGAEYTLSPQLEALAPVKDLVTVVTGLECKNPNLSPHGSGAAGILSGSPLYTDGENETFALPTIDQVIAAEIGGDTLYRSLETGGPYAGGRSYNGPNSQNPPETSPLIMFERIFGSSFREPGEDTAVDPKLALRRSVLDAVMDDIDRLQTRVGAADRARLDQHFEGIRALELRLARLQEDPPDLAACTKPAEPLADYPDLEGRPQLSEVNQAMTEILAMALACDQTRVFSHWFTDPVSDLLFQGATAGHHDLTHNEPGDQPEVDMITRMVVAEYAAMVAHFASIPEGDGTLLDSCAILGTSEVSLGKTHSISDMPILLAGNACGSLVQGHHIQKAGGENASRLLFSLCRSMDMVITEFGAEEGLVSDGLSDIEA